MTQQTSYHGSASRHVTQRLGHRFAITGSLVVILAVCALALDTLAQETGSLSPSAEAMRTAGKAAGISDIDLPLETPEESRETKKNLDSAELKFTFKIRERLRLLELDGVTIDGQVVEAKRYTLEQYSTPDLLMDASARLQVECKVDDVKVLDDAYFASIGGELVVAAEGYGLLVAWIPVDQLKAFANRNDVHLIKHIDPPQPDIGAFTSEGDAIHNADAARSSFGVDGTGQLVGVISDGVTSIATSQGTGDLPAGVTVSNAGGGDEGTAMLEIVHDLAPGADLAFCSGNPGSAGMINAIQTLAALPGITIITDDLPKPGEPLFEDGPIAQEKQTAFGAGIFYTASAGNRGNQHYEEFFNSNATNVTIGSQTYANPHDFGGGDYRLSVTLGNGFGGTANSLYLQWADPFGASANDFDLFVVDNAGNVLASSTNPQTGTQDPNESIFFNAADGTPANIIVDYVGGGAAPAVFFDLRGFSGMRNWEINIPAGSINGASRQTEVYAAGAVDAATPGTVRASSSRGPIRHFFPAQLARMKPDGIGVNGNVVTGAGGFGSGTCPADDPGEICRFFGTSASTPHVAGLAALLLESQPGLTPGQVASAFNSTAVDIDTPGPDNNAGNGRLDVFAAICAFDSDPPTITCPDDIVVQCTGDGGTSRFDPQLAAFFAGVSADDICDDNPLIEDDAPSVFLVGTTPVTFTATDDADNSASCEALVTVVDDLAPEISCPGDRNFECDDIGDFGSPTATDICDPSPSITLVLRDSIPGTCEQEYQLVLTYEAEDDASNTATCQQTITVEDTTDPIVYCPASDSLEFSFTSPTEAVVTFQAIATDNCDPDPQVMCTPPSGTTFPIGAHSVTCVADDGCGNTDECSFSFRLVPLDVKPRSCPNPLNVKFKGGTLISAAGDGMPSAGGVFPVAILSASDFDVADIDLSTVRLQGVAPLRSAFEDIATPVADDPTQGCECTTEGADGLTDLTLKFKAGDIISAIGTISDGDEVMLTLTAFLLDGTPIAGGDCVLIRAEKPDFVNTSLTAGVGGEFGAWSYPNPFNASTTIGYRVVEDGRVSLVIYNVLGQEVAVLVDDDQSAGEYSVLWSGRDDSGREVASGMYFYRLQVGSNWLTRKMTLLK